MKEGTSAPNELLSEAVLTEELPSASTDDDDDLMVTPAVDASNL